MVAPSTFCLMIFYSFVFFFVFFRNRLLRLLFRPVHIVCLLLNRIDTQRDFLAYFMLFLNDAVLNRKSILLWVEILSGTASFRRNMKWTRKSLCVAITDPPNFKKKGSSWRALVQVLIVTDHIRKRMVRATNTICLNSFAPHRWQFKI